MIPINPRLKNSKKWTSFPNECLKEINNLCLKRFKKETQKAVITVQGQIYSNEFLLRVSFLEEGRLKQSNFEASVEYDYKKENFMSLLDLTVDAVLSMMKNFFLKGDASLPIQWKKYQLEKKLIFLQYHTINTELESLANQLLKSVENQN